jgi:hypothetical protein
VYKGFFLVGKPKPWRIVMKSKLVNTNKIDPDSDLHDMIFDTESYAARIIAKFSGPNLDQKLEPEIDPITKRITGKLIHKFDS